VRVCRSVHLTYDVEHDDVSEHFGCVFNGMFHVFLHILHTKQMFVDRATCVVVSTIVLRDDFMNASLHIGIERVELSESIQFHLLLHLRRLCAHQFHKTI
jgi:hypothetical protein